MIRRPLGSSPRSVFPVGLGCMGFSWGYAPENDDAAAIGVIHRALEIGVDHFDTSDVYGPFTNEALVGRALKGRREGVVVATKVGLVVEDKAAYRFGRDGRPEHVRESCDASLHRLDIDAIDLYYLHRIDPKVPVEETWGAMAELVAAGKVRWLGISEASVEDLERVHRIHPVTAVQSELSLWTRDYLTGVVPWCAENGASFVAFSPLGRGFLTGRFAADARFDPSDFRSTLPRFGPEQVAQNQAIVERVRAVASRKGVTPAQIALAWVLSRGEHVLAIPGTQRRKYLEENAAAAAIELAPEDLADLDAIPPPAGGRY
ncbi:MAG: aldo/keto reductase [Acidobacteriota bacterium]|nr:aldo/keto reductase [Acidobacteriota bacterium]